MTFVPAIVFAYDIEEYVAPPVQSLLQQPDSYDKLLRIDDRDRGSVIIYLGLNH